MNEPPLLIEAEWLVTPAGVLEPGYLRAEGGRIVAVGQGAAPKDEGDARVLRGAVLLPGFIDLHMHGYGGAGFGAGEAEAREAARRVAETGVTTCYAGLGAGASLAAIAETVAGAASVVGTATGGAQLAGVFLEGPFISPAKKGAWNPKNLRLPDVAELRALVAASANRIRRVNVAPELPGALDFIRAARSLGITVSIGHSDASYDEALAGVAAGATITNHTYNAMSPLEHRAPGLVGATLTSEALLAELILDGVHVHPAAAQALFRAKGAAGVALITDGAAICGMADGVYQFIGRTVTVAGGACRLADGTLAGSVSGFDRDLRNAAAWLTDDLTELTALSSGNAARAMSLTERTGALAPGLDADLVLLDAELCVLATVVGGAVVWERGSAG